MMNDTEARYPRQSSHRRLVSLHYQYMTVDNHYLMVEPWQTVGIDQARVGVHLGCGGC
jgi:ElaB/YqjD/DUF883 family membrane-anchored ribosome-binding protein